MFFRKLYPIIWRDLHVSFCNLNSLINNFLAPSFLLIFYAVGMSTSFGNMVYQGKTINYFHFFFPGLIGMQLVFIMSSVVSYLVLDNQRQVNALIVFTNVTMNHYYWGKYIASVIITMTRILFLYLTAVVFLNMHIVLKWGNLLLIILALLGGIFIFYNLGFIIGALIKNESAKNFIMVMLPSLFIFSSNSYYNTDNLPILIKVISTYNPLVYLVRVLRDAILLEHVPKEWHFNLSVVFILCIILCPIALMIKNKLVYKM